MTEYSRPESLAEVSRRVRAGEATFEIAHAEFLDDFYLDTTTAGRQARVEGRPEPIGEEEIDAWLGAMGEHLAQRWGLVTPRWTGEAEFMGGEQPRFYPATPTLRRLLVMESPPAFRRRMLFTYAEPLLRARFPGPKVVLPHGDGVVVGRQTGPR